MSLFSECIENHEIEDLERKLYQYCYRKEESIAIISAGISENSEQILGALSATDLFSLQVFRSLLSSTGSYNAAHAEFMWNRLIHNGIVKKLFSQMPNFILDCQICTHTLKKFLKTNTFYNLFISPDRMVKRYSNSLLAIDVTKNGYPSRGSGFVVSVNEEKFVITCKHNVDPSEGINLDNVVNESSTVLSLSEPKLIDDRDIAIYKINNEINCPTFCLSSDVEMFDDVYTVGFPSIPGAQSTIVGHRGQVNAFLDIYLDNTPAILISNLVSPGNSGGPVLTHQGMCIGMTIRWLEAEYGSEKVRFSAAIPALEIRTAIEKSFFS